MLYKNHHTVLWSATGLGWPNSKLKQGHPLRLRRWPEQLAVYFLCPARVRKVLAAKRKSLVLTRARQRKQTASSSGHRRRRRGCPFLILNSATPIQLRFKELCGGFYTKLRSPSKRISVKRSVTVFYRSSFYRCKLNIGSISRCTFQIFHGNVKIVRNESKRRIVIDSDEDDWLWSYVCQLCPVSNLDFHLTLTWSIFQSRKYRLIDKKPFLEF